MAPMYGLKSTCGEAKTILSAKVLGSLHMLQRQAQLDHKLFPFRRVESGKKKKKYIKKETLNKYNLGAYLSDFVLLNLKNKDGALFSCAHTTSNISIM